MAGFKSRQDALEGDEGYFLCPRALLQNDKAVVHALITGRSSSRPMCSKSLKPSMSAAKPEVKTQRPDKGYHGLQAGAHKENNLQANSIASK